MASSSPCNIIKNPWKPLNNNDINIEVMCTCSSSWPTLSCKSLSNEEIESPKKTVVQKESIVTADDEATINGGSDESPVGDHITSTEVEVDASVATSLNNNNEDNDCGTSCSSTVVELNEIRSSLSSLSIDGGATSKESEAVPQQTIDGGVVRVDNDNSESVLPTNTDNHQQQQHEARPFNWGNGIHRRRRSRNTISPSGFHNQNYYSSGHHQQQMRPFSRDPRGFIHFNYSWQMNAQFQHPYGPNYYPSDHWRFISNMGNDSNNNAWPPNSVQFMQPPNNYSWPFNDVQHMRAQPPCTPPPPPPFYYNLKNNTSHQPLFPSTSPFVPYTDYMNKPHQPLFPPTPFTSHDNMMFPQYPHGHPYLPATPYTKSHPISNSTVSNGAPSKAILKQIEYYFSDENLVKDFYLKNRMDREGWVSVHLIAGFTKIKAITSDINLILGSLQDSAIVEVQGDKMRKRGSWKIWIPHHLFNSN